jgi:hypothetical protein
LTASGAGAAATGPEARSPADTKAAAVAATTLASLAGRAWVRVMLVDSVVGVVGCTQEFSAAPPLG